MSRNTPTNETVAIPAGVEVKMTGTELSVNGPRGRQARILALRGVSMKMEGNQLTVTGPLREANTALAHIRNMIRGSAEGYSQKLKVIYAHFPISLELKGREFYIKNFVGEKQPRRCRVVGDTKVEVKGAEVTIFGPSREDVGQTIANIRSATRIRRRDSRVFQDGIYPIES